MHTYKAAPDVDVVTSTNAISGFGNLAINAFVIHADEPVLVDTGSVVQSDEFMAALGGGSIQADLRWVWLTHTDFDHIGSLQRLLEQNERLRVVTSFLGFGIMGLGAPLPMDRVYLVNPGQTVDVGDRTLTAVRPPAFDNPITTGLRDERSGILFSSDCFGALLDEVPECAEDLADEDLRGVRSIRRPRTPRGCTRWTGRSSPRSWTVSRALEPTMVLSSHLSATRGSSLERLLGALSEVPDGPRPVARTRPRFEQMLAGLTG